MKVLFATAIIAAIVVAGCVLAFRPLRVPVDGSPPPGFPDDGFSHESFESLLRQYADIDGRVFDASLRTRLEQLRQNLISGDAPAGA